MHYFKKVNQDRIGLIQSDAILVWSRDCPISARIPPSPAGYKLTTASLNREAATRRSLDMNQGHRELASLKEVEPMIPTTLRNSSEMAMRSCADEPTIREMLADPVARAMMAVDHVRPAEVLSLFPEARQRLGVIDGA